MAELKNEEILEKLNELIKQVDMLNEKIERKDKRLTGSIERLSDSDKGMLELINNKVDAILYHSARQESSINEINRKIAMILDKIAKSVKASKINEFAKRMNDVTIIASSVYFDWKWYANKYNIKVVNAKKAAAHYLEKGWKLYYDPSPYFITVSYLIANWDVKEAGCNPLLHYEKSGREEHRSLGNIEGIQTEYNLVKWSEYFDEPWYRKRYNLEDDMDAVYHFLLLGMWDYNDPSPKFSTLDYLMDNVHEVGDVQNALVHYERNKKSGKKLVIQEVKEHTADNSKYEECAYVDQQEKDILLSKKNKVFDRSLKTVDIIICVYNAYEDVKCCIESVLKYTSTPYEIIIVDDNSEELTASYLRGVAEKNINVKLIRNESDLHGYTYAANIGLRNAEADYCVMLNSDTIVSEHWIDNMMACCESDMQIGVVGPLSNTASWQSVPKLIDDDGDWCHNVIPEGFTVSMVAKMIESNSGKIYPQVPFLNGFCLMIKREVINKIGYFDEENFGRGFAEEDDFNTRAIKAGFKLAIADDTYVYHAQSKSYTDEKRLALCKLSGEALRKKHGREYIDSCSSFMATNRILDSIRKRVDLMFEKEKIYKRCKEQYKGKRILFLLPGSNASGGANVVVQESMALMRMGVDVTILNVEGNKKEYGEAYGNVNIPIVWVKDYADFDMDLAKNYDIIVCTLFRTVEYCKFLEEVDSPKVLYYIQDYEPYFIQEEVSGGDYDHKEYERAVKSYTLISSCINVTKTQWNRDEVKKNTGADCIVLGPSINTTLFMPRTIINNRQIVIAAMIRPNTKRRAPQMTFDVLRKLSLEFGNRIKIKIFGADPGHDLYSKLFFAKQQKDFKYINYGLTSPEQTAIILANSDIFLDLSEFQAMGLTAMEAMACGCATVVPQNGGTGCFARDGENCLVIDTLDYNKCLEAAESLIVDKILREKLGKNAYKDIAEYYPEKVAEKFLKTAFEK